MFSNKKNKNKYFPITAKAQPFWVWSRYCKNQSWPDQWVDQVLLLNIEISGTPGGYFYSESNFESDFNAVKNNFHVYNKCIKPRYSCWQSVKVALLHLIAAIVLLLSVTHYLSHAICHLLSVTCYSLFAIMILAFWYPLYLKPVSLVVVLRLIFFGGACLPMPRFVRLSVPATLCF